MKISWVFVSVLVLTLATRAADAVPSAKYTQLRNDFYSLIGIGRYIDALGTTINKSFIGNFVPFGNIKGSVYGAIDSGLLMAFNFVAPVVKSATLWIQNSVKDLIGGDILCLRDVVTQINDSFDYVILQLKNPAPIA